MFSSLTVGQYIPAQTGTHAYLAHWAQTLDFFTKTANVDRYFKGDFTAPEAEEVLNASSVDYVFIGPAEKQLGEANPLAGQMRIVYQNPLVAIYQYEK